MHRRRWRTATVLLSSGVIALTFVGSAAAAGRTTTPLVSAPVTLSPPATVIVAAPTSPTGVPANDPFQPVPAPVPAATAHVSIVDYAFSPATITVSAGTTVTWTNTGAAIHSVTSDSGAFDSSPSCPSSACLDPGASFAHSFASAGRFSYHCRVHAEMVGTVVVSAAPPSTTSTTTTGTSPPVSAGGAAGNPTTTAGSTGPQLAFTGTSSTEAWLVLSALFTISIGLALRPRRRAFPIPVPSRRPPDRP